MIEQIAMHYWPEIASFTAGAYLGFRFGKYVYKPKVATTN